MAYSLAIKLDDNFFSSVRLSINTSIKDELPSKMNIKQIENLTSNIENKEIDDFIVYNYESKSFFTFTYIALNNLIQSTKRNISVCQNCGRYYLQYSGKEVYFELPNQDGSPSCKSYASRKAYDIKVVEDAAEFAYKREYQRRITQVYRAKEIVKPLMRKEFTNWKAKARKQLKLYREGKISGEEFCNWIEDNK